MKKSKDLNSILGIKFEDLKMSPRALLVLEEHGVFTMKELCVLDKSELSGFGNNVILELEQVLIDFGLNFGLKL